MAVSTNPNRDCLLAWEAMPDALLGELTPQQGAWLDAHLAECGACRVQFAQQQRLKHAMSLPLDLPMDVESGVQRLLARIDNPDIPAARPPARATGWAGRALVAAVLVQAIGLGAMGARLWSLEPAAPAASAAPEYRTLSREDAPLPAGAIRVVPDPGMTLGDWDALLASNGLHVVSGPNGVGAYTVVSDAGTAGRDALLERLRGAQGVRLAEPVAGAP